MSKKQQLIKTHYKVFLPDGTVTDGTVDWPLEPGLDLIHAVIDPALGPKAEFEHVYVLTDFHGDGKFEPLDLFVDEMGAPHLKNLPRNKAATRIYRHATLAGQTSLPVPDDPEQLPAIYGPAVLFDRTVWY